MTTQRLRRQWMPFSATVGANLGTGTNSISSDLLANMKTNLGREMFEFTILDIRATLYVEPASVGQENLFAAALMLSPASRTAAGVTAFGSPFTEWENYIAYVTDRTRNEVYETAAGTFVPAIHAAPLSSKAMRKARNQDTDLIAVVRNQSGPNADFNLQGAVLVGFK